MRSKSIGHHISSQFNLELEDIHDKVLAMGGLVEQQFKFAVLAFINCDIALAEKVFHKAKQVDDYEILINQECSKILACRQPEAFDLRMLIVIIKTITELQRIDNIALHIARRAIQSCTIEKKSDDNHEVQHMYEIVKEMLHFALDAYANLKNDYVLGVTAEKHTVNGEYTIILQQLLAKIMQDTHSIKHAMNVLFTVRDIEHIAENAVHICKNVFYLIEGENVEHINANEIAQKLRNQDEL
jgi:phosphate transport system protein